MIVPTNRSAEESQPLLSTLSFLASSNYKSSAELHLITPTSARSRLFKARNMTHEKSKLLYVTQSTTKAQRRHEKGNMLPRAVLEKHIPRPAKIPDQPEGHGWEKLGGVGRLESLDSYSTQRGGSALETWPKQSVFAPICRREQPVEHRRRALPVDFFQPILPHVPLHCLGKV